MRKVAIVCDWLTNYGGAERVIETLSDMYPQAPIFTSIYNEKVMTTFQHKQVIPSFIQKLPGARRNHRLYLKLMPYAFEQFDLSEFDIVISSAHSCAKGVITKPETLHISYCHNPMRYVWDNHHGYISQHRLHRGLKSYIHYLLSDIRLWDRLAADRVDFFVANSKCVAGRIKKYYRRESEVIYPPCDVSRFRIGTGNRSYFLAIGRLIPYKRFDLIVETFNRLKFPLKIVGQGSELKHLRKAAASNIEFLGNVPEQSLNEIYGKAKALIFPQVEDFGITPVEAMACGTPIIAYKDGGAVETIIDNKTGLFFHEQSVESLSQAIKDFSQKSFSPGVIRKQAMEFDRSIFVKRFSEFVEKKLVEWHNRIGKESVLYN